jgi:hypothetical protein
MVVPEPSVDVDHFYFMDDYRKIWRDANGPIPIDEFGRSYEIHHIDGNRNNNELSNLICVSIEDHYKIHSEQKDYLSALIIASRMNVSPQEKSKLARLSMLIKKADGSLSDACKKASETKKRRGTSVEAGKKSFQTKIDKGTVESIYKKIAQKRKLNGTNNKNGSDKKIRCILQYDMEGNFIKEWPSIAEARKQIGGAPHKCAAGIQKQSMGYIWKWKTNKK